MNKYGLTDQEWAEFCVEYEAYLDGKETNTLADTIRIRNLKEQQLHEERKRVALNRIRELRRAVKEQEERHGGKIVSQ